MKRKFLILMVALTALYIVATIIKYSAVFRWNPNNDIEFRQAISTKFSNAEINDLKQRFQDNKLTLFYFKFRYQPQCIRQSTQENEYAILLSEDEKRIFVFWNTTTNKIYAVYEVSAFLKYEDFSTVVIGKTSFEDILLLDPNGTDTSVKASLSTGHIVTEGVVNIEYDVDTQIVKAMQFYSNDEIIDSLSEYPIMFIPYILPQDKIGNTGDGTITEQSGAVL